MLKSVIDDIVVVLLLLLLLFEPLGLKMFPLVPELRWLMG